MSTAGVIRMVLVVDILAMATLALIYLRQRQMSWAAYCYWGLIAVLLPVLGPFLLISNRPGEWHPDPFPSAALRGKIRQNIQGYFNQALRGISNSKIKQEIRKRTQSLLARFSDSERSR